MSTFSQYLSPENILLQMQACTKEEVFSQVAGRLERAHHLDRELIYEGLCERERLGTTAIGQGIAIPHARIKGLQRPIAAFIRLERPIRLNAPDEKPVSSLFLFLVPGRANYEHLQILAEIAEMLCDSHFREQLREATELHQVKRLFGMGV